MAKFRKKPVVIEAIQWTGDNQLEFIDFFGDIDGVVATSRNKYMEISTLEGVMRANPGDWIIKGVKGEFYPCKPDIFQQTYEPTDPTECPDIISGAIDRKGGVNE